MVSSLSRLPEFDLVRSVAVNSCHNLFLEVVKRLFLKMFVEDTQSPWYVGRPNRKRIIDERLTSIRTPTKLARRTRSVNNHADWKATEWRNWILFYALPCLQGVLPEPYYQHLALLSTAAYIFNQECITVAELTIARNNISQFRIQYQQLYEEDHMSFNVHLLSHLHQTVQDWGPLWVHTAFPFESWNNRIVGFVTAGFKRAHQIVARYLLYKFLDSMLDDDNVAAITKKHLQRLLLKNKWVDPPAVSTGFYFKGEDDKIIDPSERMSQVTHAAIRDYGENIRITYFKKALIHGTIYQIETNAPTLYCNHLMRSVNGFWTVFAIVNFVVDGQQEVHGIVGRKLHVDEDANTLGTRHIKQLTANDDEEFSFIPSNDVLAPAIKIAIDLETPENVRTSITYLVPLSNCWETD